MWGYVGEIAGEDLVLGEIEGSRTYLFPHLHFKLGVNGDNIVSANVYTQSHRKVDITDAQGGDVDVTFSYSVEWVNEANLEYNDRMSRYVNSAFLPDSLEIHWLSIINSFVLVLLLTTFLSVILIRILKKDFSKYMDLAEDIGAGKRGGNKRTRLKKAENPAHKFEPLTQPPSPPLRSQRKKRPVGS